MINTIFMLDFIKKIINGELSRLDWNLDFNFYFIEYYPKMCAENLDLAEDFALYFSDLHDESFSLTDKQLIAKLKSNYKKISNSHRLPT